MHVKWSGCDTAGEWRTVGKSEGRFPGQCYYVTSSITDHSPGVYKLKLAVKLVSCFPRRGVDGTSGTVHLIRHLLFHLIMHLIVAVNCFVYCFFMHCLSKYFLHGTQMLSFCFVCIYILFAFLHIISLSLPLPLCSPLCILKIFCTPLSSSAWQTALI